MHGTHRFDDNSCLYDTVPSNYSEMDLSISGHLLFKDGSPVNVPTGEDGACITCNGEYEWLPMHMRETRAIIDVRDWSVLGRAHHGVVVDFETTTGLRSSCVAF